VLIAGQGGMEQRDEARQPTQLHHSMVARGHQLSWWSSSALDLVSGACLQCHLEYSEALRYVIRGIEFLIISPAQVFTGVGPVRDRM
jgi:hypothetical protein